MKKRPVIGLSITVLALSVIFGIASLPDEVLIDPSSIKSTQTLPEDIPLVPTLEEAQDFSNSGVQKNMDDTKAELDALKKEIIELKNELVDLKINSQVPEETLTITKVEDVVSKVDSQEESQVDSEEESQGKVFKINMKDGVGAKQR